ncbi:MAG: hypothetical protein AAF714_00315 [Pseudomonadota bacterium]
MVPELTASAAERHSALQNWVDRGQRRMRLSSEGEDVIAEGWYDLRPEMPGHSPDAVLASYELKIVLTPKVERIGPRVFETGQAIPRCDERHIGQDGWCCIGVFSVWRATAHDRRYIAFLDDPLRNFFIGQFAVDQGLEWPFGEHHHGSMGVIEAAAEFLGCEPKVRAVKDTLRLMPVLRARGTSVAYRTCPCGSRRTLGRCCFDRLYAQSLSVDPVTLAAISADVEREARAIKGMKPLNSGAEGWQ